VCQIFLQCLLNVSGARIFKTSICENICSSFYKYWPIFTTHYLTKVTYAPDDTYAKQEEVSHWLPQIHAHLCDMYISFVRSFVVRIFFNNGPDLSAVLLKQCRNTWLCNFHSLLRIPSGFDTKNSFFPQCMHVCMYLCTRYYFSWVLI